MKDSNFKMVLILCTVAAVAAFVLSLVNMVTREKIQQEYRQEFLNGLNAILPEYDNEPDKNFSKIKDKNIYIAKNDNKTVGYAIKSISSKGYSGDIVVLVGVKPDGRINGIEILRHAETPGLGAKITEESWQKSFDNLTVNDGIAVKKDGGIIDQFSGATISPRAVCEAVEKGLKFINKNVLESDSDS
ncbi:electron transport complex, RnfABCDGE type, G subunit [Flexistipes sinusarabici DSM 4947]|uniref:Ion-translocating oxidoreductase complex subunit G n=1 Tax=Flexistipes sinusarabici (strain ATCC 49648 / DSM 4947 / MAS 10) TaxID=717231 RepID=F8E896_FLESM|nr:RnfABCDGE type electron transport complex subunit G [Flexistipes sinusarabici]AEI15093.1 electron transport complex, RnfABCDGE type, G subunit [Flexistipes sinusarabici DSM 4947]